jgi:hypothetical protein
MKNILIITLLFITSCSVNKSYQPERFCIVVEEVRRSKKCAIIKPKCQDPNYKGKMLWYRYPTPNVFVGDTVDVSDNQLITGPRF